MTDGGSRRVRAAPRPRKRLGQHFLIDPNIVRKTLALAALQAHECVVEIGPGRGILTRALCNRARRVIAVELDRELYEYLTEALGDLPNLDLRLGDALQFPYETLPEGTVVVSNLPYYLTTPLLFTLLDARRRLSRMVLMVQAEVADRLVADPGTADYGVLSVLTRYWTEPSFGFRVSPACFRPRPEVDSAVVSLAIRRAAAVEVRDELLFLRLVRAAFAHRRKTLINSLRDEGFAPDVVRRALGRAGFGHLRRAETLSLEEFALLANAWVEEVTEGSNR